MLHLSMLSRVGVSRLCGSVDLDHATGVSRLWGSVDLGSVASICDNLWIGRADCCGIGACCRVRESVDSVGQSTWEALASILL